MKKVTLCMAFLCTLLTCFSAVNAQTTTAQIQRNTQISPEIQAQINEARELRGESNSQNLNRTLSATYVGSFNTNNGPYWGDNPSVYNGLEAAALLFGGSPSDYAISTDPNTTDPSTITHTAWASTWGVYGCEEVAEDYSVDLGAPGYNDPGGAYSATSVYVQDNCDSAGQNFVWRIDSVVPDAFITTWQTTMTNETITIPTTGGGYNYSVNWGDGSTVAGVTGNATHTYAVPGVYTVSIHGSFPRIYFNNSGDRLKIRSIEQWGSNIWTSMNGAFAGAGNLVSNATDMPDLSMVTDMYGMFAYARQFNGDANFGNWDVSNVTNMYGMFGGASVFNYPIGNWDVSNVTNMSNMFNGATNFNQNLNSWNVANVTNMSQMFTTAFNFNGSINNWNVGNVTDMSGMFSYARKFNQTLENWNVGNVTNMLGMFGGASEFNQNIGNWNVGAVTNMGRMFEGATVFDQNLNSWNVSNVTNMDRMFGTAMNFNGAIGNWDVSNVTNMYGMFGYARKFNQNIGNWNVANVTNMYGMFGAASVFNQDISNWNVGNVTTMEDMFNGATKFNQYIGDWNVEKVKNMDRMFRTAMSFNQDISNWNVGKVTTMNSTFAYARKFDQNLGSWNVSKVSDMTNMFLGVKLSTANYDSLLNGWNSQNLKSNVKFNGGSSKYCAGEAARQNMINTYNWTITDGGMDCTNPFTAPRLEVENNVMLAGISLYPNPVGEQLNIAALNGQQLESVSIYDLAGRLIKTVNLEGVSSETTLDVSHLSKATYMVVIEGNGGRVSKLMVKE